MKRILLVLLVIATTISPSCKKGLDGINGKDGKDGANGKDGSNGKDGKDGTISVVSMLYTITNWNYDSDQIGYYANLNVSSFITSSIKTSGVILVYIQGPNQLVENAWSPLPVIFYPTSSYSRQVTFAFSPNTSTVTIWIKDSDRLAPSPLDLNIRVVGIPGTLVSSHRNLDYNNFELVSNTFSLK